MLQQATQKLGFLRTSGILFAVAVSLTIVTADIVLAWFFFYSGDLPDIKAIARYAPKQASSVSDACLERGVVAIPSDALGYNFRAALNAAEGYDRAGYSLLSFRISRTMFCAPSRTLEREWKEARLAEQLKMHFSHDDLVTIFANRVGFGENINGVKAASEYYFGKGPDELNIADAALLAGLVQAPSRYSPFTHPDRALQRRNAVIDAMVRLHSISDLEGNAAKAAPLAVTATR